MGLLSSMKTPLMNEAAVLYGVAAFSFLGTAIIMGRKIIDMHWRSCDIGSNEYW